MSKQLQTKQKKKIVNVNPIQVDMPLKSINNYISL